MDEFPIRFIRHRQHHHYETLRGPSISWPVFSLSIFLSSSYLSPVFPQPSPPSLLLCSLEGSAFWWEKGPSTLALSSVASWSILAGPLSVSLIRSLFLETLLSPFLVFLSPLVKSCLRPATHSNRFRLTTQLCWPLHDNPKLSSLVFLDACTTLVGYNQVRSSFESLVVSLAIIVSVYGDNIILPRYRQITQGYHLLILQGGTRSTFTAFTSSPVHRSTDSQASAKQLCITIRQEVVVVPIHQHPCSHSTSR